MGVIMRIEHTTTEDIISTTKPLDWEDLIAVIRSSPTLDNYLSSQDRNTIEIDRDPFHEINE
jgi:hypothetical protein